MVFAQTDDNREQLRITAINALRQGEYELAKQKMQQYISGSDSVEASALVTYGDILYKNDVIDSALYYLLMAREIDKQNSNVNYNLAVVYYNHPQINHNVPLYYIDEEIKYNPDDIENYLLKTDILIDAERYEEAIESINNILRINENVSDAYIYRGMISFRREKFEDALKYYSKAISLNNSEPGYYVRRASTYALLEKYELALDDCFRAKKIDPQYLDAYIVELPIYEVTKFYILICPTVKKIKKIAPDHDLSYYINTYKCGRQN